MTEDETTNTRSVVKPWILRAYLPEDQRSIQSLWSEHYTRSRAGYAQGAAGAGERMPDGSWSLPTQKDVEAKRSFKARHAPILNWLLATQDCQLCVDPQMPDAINAFVILGEPNVIHTMFVKRDLQKLGLARPMVEDLLGDRLRSQQVVTMDLPQVSAILGHSWPPNWQLDPTWIVTRMIEETS